MVTSGLWLWPSWSYLKSVYNASWGHPHMYLSPCDQITLDWWKYHVWSVWEAAWPRWAEREWENWYWWMIWYKMQHWTVWKINIFTGSEDIIRLIFLFTMLPPDAQTTCGPFELNGFCGAHATTPTFLPPPPFISPGEAHWRIVTHSDSSLPLVGFAKHTELFAWAKKKKSLCLFHEDA